MNAGVELRSLTWMRSGTTLFLASMARLADTDLDAPTGLPGWSRRHLLSHVGFNALALRRLARWARTGEPTPMYASPAQRNAEIAEGAGWDAPRLRDHVTATAADLDADLAALDGAAWRAEVGTAQGRTVPADQIPWMRTREVTVHAVDLGSGTTFADLPEDLCVALVDDVVARRNGQRGDPPVMLRSTSGRGWTIGDDPASVVTGSPAALARWLTGRGADGLTTAGDSRSVSGGRAGSTSAAGDSRSVSGGRAGSTSAAGGPLPALTPWL